MQALSLREAAGRVFDAAVRAADPAEAVRNAAGRLPIDDAGAVWVVGAGKATRRMADGLCSALGDRICGGVIVVPYGWAGDGPPHPRVRVRQAGHPAPDAAGVEATFEVLDLLRGAAAGDLVVGLTSGGGSALLAAPRPPHTLADLVAETSRLLAGGLPIAAVNARRRELLRAAAGGLSRAAAAARVRNLVVSDVVGGRVDVIASGPFDAADSEVVLTNGPALAGAAICAAALGFVPRVATDALEGEAREVGRAVVADLLGRGRRGGSATLFGGETTVTLPPGTTPPGGRCQELALAAALALEAAGRPGGACVLAAGTDGRDGPTDAAGAVVDGETAGRVRAAGVDPERALREHRAHAALDAAGALIRTGPTGTNVMDVIVALRA